MRRATRASAKLTAASLNPASTEPTSPIVEDAADLEVPSQGEEEEARHETPETPLSPSPSEVARLDLEEHKKALISSHQASTPYNQFRAEFNDELRPLLNAIHNATGQQPQGTSLHQFINDRVKARWIEQGIWRTHWDSVHGGIPGPRWRHEVGPEHDDAPRGLFHEYFDCLPANAVGRRKKRERRDASRPCQQFVYQVARERERIEIEMRAAALEGDLLGGEEEGEGGGEEDGYEEYLGRLAERGRGSRRRRRGHALVGEVDPRTLTPRINTMAYERVKKTWERRGIWDDKWGVLPGMSWKHEYPLKEMLRQDLGEDVVTEDSEGGGDGESVGAMEVPRRGSLDAFGHAQPRAHFRRVMTFDHIGPPMESPLLAYLGANEPPALRQRPNRRGRGNQARDLGEGPQSFRARFGSTQPSRVTKPKRKGGARR